MFRGFELRRDISASPEILRQHQVGIFVVELRPRDRAAVAGDGKVGCGGSQRLCDFADPGQLVIRKTQKMNVLAPQEINPLSVTSQEAGTNQSQTSLSLPAPPRRIPS